jgi:cyclopropane-fatty-acyl-phospholipid synthase
MSVASTLTGLVARVAGDDLPVAVHTWDGGHLGPPDAPATIEVRSPDALGRFLHAPGQLGLARAYVAGDLVVRGDLLTALQELWERPAVHPRLRDWWELLRLGGPALLRHLPPPAEEARMRGRRHSLRRDRGAVTHHYDLSNDFYRMVLGPSMAYSCGVWERPEVGLEAAQAAKHDLVARKLDLRAGQRLLDVGCGWGGMVGHAAAHFGARAVGVTLSEAQAGWARAVVEEAGLPVEIRVQDYRRVQDGPYDAISSIGMSEHVGRGHLPQYFRTLHAQLRPGGRLLNHAITSLPRRRAMPDGWPAVLPRGIRERRSGFARDSFVGRYVFPDGELVEVGEVISAMQQAGFEVRHVESFREHYGLTLRAWVANLEAHWDEAVATVGLHRARIWRLYLAGSALTFELGRTGIHQVLAVKPDGGDSGMPLVPTRPGDWARRP